MEYKTLPLDQAQIKLADGRLTGYASVFGGVDSYGDTVHPGAFANVVGTGLEVKMYFNHGWKKGELPIGKMQVKEDEHGLRVESAEFTPGLALADQVKAAVAHQTVTGFSIGYAVAAGGSKPKVGGGRDIYEFKRLKEVSVVDWPADGYAQIDLKSAINEAGTLKEVESLLRDAGGFSRADACGLVARVKSLAHGEREASTWTAAEITALFKTD